MALEFDAQPPSYFERWREATITHVLVAILLGGFVLPSLILIGGIMAVVIWDALTGR
jgi:hypothetical protein